MRKILSLTCMVFACLLPGACQRNIVVYPLYGPPTATFTSVLTPTPTGTWYSPTPTASMTSTVPNTPTWTSSWTPTGTATLTPTPSASSTPTSTGTPATSTFTFTPTGTSTATPSWTPTDTSLITNTPTNSPTGTLTPSSPSNTPTVGSTVYCLFPQTSGLTIVGPNTVAGAGNIVASLWAFSANYNGLVSVSVYLGNASGMASMALYDTDLGNTTPTTVLVQSAPQAAVNGWNTFPMPAYHAPGGPCWVACQVQGSTEIYYSPGSGSLVLAHSVAYAWSGGVFPSAYPAGGVGNPDFLNMYMVFCAENSPTPTLTPTLTATSTFTLTPTITFTHTPTSTPTSTPTPTSTIDICAGTYYPSPTTSGTHWYTGYLSDKYYDDGINPYDTVSAVSAFMVNGIPETGDAVSISGSGLGTPIALSYTGNISDGTYTYAKYEANGLPITLVRGGTYTLTTVTSIGSSSASLALPQDPAVTISQASWSGNHFYNRVSIWNYSIGGLSLQTNPCTTVNSPYTYPGTAFIYGTGLYNFDVLQEEFTSSLANATGGFFIALDYSVDFYY